MFAAMTQAQLERVGNIDMQPDYPVDFEPEQILYREIISINRGFGGIYKTRDEPRPIVGSNYTSVEDFAKKIAAGRYSDLDPVGQVLPEVRPLDIVVGKPSFIVLLLSPDEGGWTFAGTSAQAAVTLGDPPTGDPALYGGLTYVTPTSVTRTRKAGCAVVFFAAMPSYGTVGAPYIQKLSYVILGEDGYNNSMDPDIRYPGQ